MRARFSVFIFLICLTASSSLWSQAGYEVGVRTGTAAYLGDLNTDYNLSSMGFSFGLVARRNVNERICYTAGLDYGRISASDANSNNFFQRTRNLSFHSDVFDLNAVMEFNFFPYIHGSDENYYTPYLYGGFSVMKYNPQASLDGTTYTLRDLGTEGQQDGQEYSLITGSWVFGIGFKWDINRDWSFNASISGRKVFTDYLDDVSGEYPDFLNLEARRGPVAVALSNRSLDPDFARSSMQRGNGKNNDLVYFFNIGIMRYIGELNCPSISKIKY